jgi:hypothetical protein
VLGIPQIDVLLELFRYHQPATPNIRPGWNNSENLEDEVYHERIDSSVPSPLRQPSRSKPAVIELSSRRSGAGKSTLLYLLVAQALLPTEYGGKASTAVWVDTDGAFSALRVQSIITQRLSTLKAVGNIEAIASNALHNLFVLKPTSSPQLLEQLNNLPEALLCTTSNQALSLVVFDSATAFQHQDRSASELARLEAGSDWKARQAPPSQTSQVISALRAIQSQFECSIVFSTTPHTPSPGPRPYIAGPHTPKPTPFHHSEPEPHVLPQPDEPASVSPWTAFATLSLTLEKATVSQFPPNMTLEECLRDREKRQAAVREGRASVGIDRSDAGRWTTGIRDRLDAMQGKGGFTLVMKGDVVELQ